MFCYMVVIRFVLDRTKFGLQSAASFHGASWLQNNDEDQKVTPSSLPLISSSGPELAFGASSPFSEFRPYEQGWSHRAAMYSQEPDTYYSYHGYQESVALGNSFRSNSNCVTRGDTGAASKKDLEGNYTSSQIYSEPYQPLLQTGGCRPAARYTPVEAPRLNTSIAHTMSTYEAETFPYTSPIASPSASPPSTINHASSTISPERSQMDTEYSVPCPYRCGTVLTGVHALGNLTRHLKTQACVGSSRPKFRYPCPIENCDRQYARSDGLRVHMRRRHGAPQPARKTDSMADDDDD
ncbi:hypothetical protein GMOD_00002332 [Pyrenophora seminiperda CCB06]|uniref:C2H2-type domain-containing protein n=1 Tax=Pyrenophora seminiperda CCB06 TaxID=1302712 RepID=A0A3M7LXH1_9PLEO|nr:hypothetical protein GMOD_00002332 [Pyrenophora seminiperda CCB06]